MSIEVGEGSPALCTLSPDRVVTLGRNRSNSVVLQDKHASRWHAEVAHEEGRWILRDCGTLNGTRRNGQRIPRPTPLMHGDEIGIGDTVVRFLLDGQPDIAASPTPLEVELPDTPLDDEPSSRTALLPDELGALCTFMKASLRETAPQALVGRALTTVLNQTGAATAGYLSFDPDDLPRLVLPQKAQIDAHLSRQLTQRMLTRNRPVWLAGEGDDTPDSLMSVKDAVCLPLSDSAGRPFAALHVYKNGQGFSEREVRFCEVLAGFLGSCLQLLRSRRQLEAENSRLREHHTGDDALIGDGPAMNKLRETVARLASGPSTVLVVGESGVGKELVALALHRESDRGDGPLVTVNCAAIAPTLMESELFGHMKGAFSGADRTHPGFFEQADEGTLFLDEIGELSPECQAKLLRVMEGKGFRPVGGTSDVRVDVRIVAATNRDLEAEVEAGRFRDDLFYRLRIPVRVPPLREHPEDIPALADHFLARLAVEYRRPVRLTEAAMTRLREYSWPGNVRQLRSVLETAVAMSDHDDINADDLPLGPDRRRAGGGLPSLNLEELEADAVRQAMRQTEGNKAQAARLLGIHRETLMQKLRKYEIEKE
ncbi:MAG TPA: sigma 54-interacting transcriptional regulator [Gemmataceae bacterium]|nr:sigma 54-interacting transcriptional regulator [Gemmataceae bacterium]